jgi:hypothetical protein
MGSWYKHPVSSPESTGHELAVSNTTGDPVPVLKHKKQTQPEPQPEPRQRASKKLRPRSESGRVKPWAASGGHGSIRT